MIGFRCLIALSVVASVIAVILPILMAASKHAYEDDRSAWYLAQREREKPVICGRALNGSCDAGWTGLRSRCYRTTSDVGPRASAQISCEAIGGAPVSIHDAAENALVSELCAELVDLGRDGQVSCWIGLARPSRAEAWYWEDGSKVDYQNWGRAPKLVGDYEGVTVNGLWVLAGTPDVVSLAVNAFVLCGSTLLLVYAVHAQSTFALQTAIKGEGICSVLCLAALLVWGLGHSAKDPSRNGPLVILCALESLATLVVVVVQLCCVGWTPDWHVATPPVRSGSRTAPAIVQAQCLPP